MNCILSVDPGIKGACAIFYGQELHNAFSFHRNTEWRDLLFYKLQFLKPTKIYVEDVHSFSGQGVKSMHTFGKSIEAVHTTIRLAGFYPKLITPQLWQKHLGLLRKEKKDHKELALKLFPQLVEVKGDVFDAVLIGYSQIMADSVQGTK